MATEVRQRAAPLARHVEWRLSGATTIWLQLAALWLLFAFAFALAALRDRRVPADDIGLVLLLAMLAYHSLPPLVWLLQDGFYTSALSGRLLQLQPPAEAVIELQSVVLGVVIGIAAVYLPLRLLAPRAQPVGRWAMVPDEVLLSTLALLALSTLFLFGVHLLGMVRGAESYVDSYRAILELPLILRQLLKIAQGTALVCQLVLLVAILQRGRRFRVALVAYVLLLLLTYDPAGPRTALVAGLVSMLLGWHLLVRPIGVFGWSMLGGLGFLAFTLGGVARQVGGWDPFSLLQTHDLLTLGELEALWANGIELQETMRSSGIELAWHVRYGEFFAFIPSQLLPFEKLSLDRWYLEQFHQAYADDGGGWAFGLVAQAVIGGGVFEAVLRGLLLGLLAIAALAWSRLYAARWWVLPIYLYLTVNAYLAVRNSMLAPLTGLLQVALPTLVLLWLGGLLLRKPAQPRADAAVSR